MRVCQELPGRELFQYADEQGVVHDIGSGDVNDYLRESTSTEFTAKDVRTWTGTVLATDALRQRPEFSSVAQAKRHVNAAIEEVAEALGNTRAVCRRCYIHPVILDAYLEGALPEKLDANMPRRAPRALHSLTAIETAVLGMLQRPTGKRVASRRTA